MSELQRLSKGSIVLDYSEFSGESPESIANKILRFKELTMVEFRQSESQFDFYENSKTYIYDLLGAHPDKEGPVNKIEKFLPGVLNYVKSHPGSKFLEFGGGIGDICEHMAVWAGKDVTYMDIDSHITNFARWRFQKYGVPVKMEIIPQDRLVLTDTYDFIYQDAVLEHLSPEQQVGYTGQLADALNEDGVFVMIVDLAGETDDMPMHYNVDIQSVHKVLLDRGMTCHHGLHTFASVWTK